VENAVVCEFQKGALIQRIVALPPGSRYRLSWNNREGRGVFVARGGIEVRTAHPSGETPAAREGDIVYSPCIEGEEVTLANRREVEAVLLEIDLHEPIGSKWRGMCRKEYRALVVTVSAITDPTTRTVPDGVRKAIRDMANTGIPVLIADDTPSWIRQAEGSDPIRGLAHNGEEAIALLKRDEGLDEKDIVVIGCHGDRNESEHDFLDRYGGISLGSFDPAGSVTIHIRHICGLPPGPAGLLWALERLQFRGALRR
jgi:hypothetical protein